MTTTRNVVATVTLDPEIIDLDSDLELDDPVKKETSPLPSPRRSNRPKSKISEKIQPHHKAYCIFCTAEFLKHNSQAASRNESYEFSNLPDESGIFFILEKCLGISNSDCTKLLNRLNKKYKDQSQWEANFCFKHENLVVEAQELHSKIVQLKMMFVKLKKKMKKITISSFEKENIQPHPHPFRMIRDTMSSVAVKAMKLEDEIDENVLNDDPKSKVDDPEDVTISNPENFQENPDLFMTENDIKLENYDEDHQPFHMDPSGPGSFPNLDDDAKEPWKDVLSPILSSENDFSNSESNDDNLTSKNEKRSAPIKLSRVTKDKLSMAPRTRKKPIKKSKVSKLSSNSLLRRARSATVRRKCRVCPKYFLTPEERDSHQITEHGEGKHHPCTHCSKRYSGLAELRVHIKRDHETNRPFSCELCLKSFPMKKDLNSHSKNQHPSAPVKCPHCDKEYYKPKTLSHHILAMHKRNPPGHSLKTLNCELCSKTYKLMEDLKLHQGREHFGAPLRVICDECGKQLSDIRSLKKHKQSQHLKSFKFQCDKCDTKCLFKSHLNAHMIKIHGHSAASKSKGLIKKAIKPKKVKKDVTKSVEGDPYECYRCGEEFYTRSQLHNHKISCAQFAYL